MKFLGGAFEAESYEDLEKYGDNVFYSCSVYADALKLEPRSYLEPVRFKNCVMLQAAAIW